MAAYLCKNGAAREAFILSCGARMHIHVALINEGLTVVRHFSCNIAQMKISDPLPAISVDGVVDVTFGHLRQRSHAKFQGIALARNQVD